MKPVELSVENIEPHPRNVRHQVDVDQDLRDLADSIASVGIEQPVTVVPIPEDEGGYWLVAGHRRVAAAKLAGLDAVPAIVRDDLTTEAAQVRFMWIENHHRKDLTPVEEGDGLQAIMDLEGLNQTELAKSVGKSRKVVGDRLKIASLPDAARKVVETGQVTIDDAVKLAEFNDDPDVQAKLAAELGRSAWSFQHHYESAKGRKKKAGERAELLASLEGQGVTVLDEYPDDEHLEVEADLVDEDALTKITDDDQAAIDAVYAKAVADHKECPGHAAVVLGPTQFDPVGSLSPVWVCTKPELHVLAATDGGKTGKSEPAGPTPEELQERQDAEELAAAAKVRRRYLGSLLRADDTQHLALQAARRDWYWITTNQATPRLRRTLAEILYDAPDAIDDEDLDAKIMGTIRTLDLAQLTLLASYDLHDEIYLTDPGPWNWGRTGYDRSGDWREQLEQLGYEWSDVERRLIGLDEDPDTESDDDGEVA